MPSKGPRGPRKRARKPAPPAPTVAVSGSPSRVDPRSPVPGMYPGVPFEVYRSWNAINASTLKTFRRSARHAQQQALHPSAETDSQRLGHAAHASVLEPKVFTDGYVMNLQGTGDDCNKDGSLPRRKTEHKLLHQKFEAENLGKVIMTRRDFEYCTGIRKSVWAHPFARKLLEGQGLAEVSIVWKDEETGLICKARIDWLTMMADNTGAICDLKTTKAADKQGFSREIANYDYELSAAFYLDGLDTLQPHPRHHYLIAVENFGSFEPACYELDEPAMEQGRTDYRRFMRMYDECIKTGKWPGYHHDVQSIGLPKWKATG